MEFFMSSSDKSLGKLAVKLGLITENQLQECLQIQEQKQKSDQDMPGLLDILVERQYLTQIQKEKLIEDWKKKNQQLNKPADQMKEDENKQHIICQSCGAHFRLDIHKLPKNFKCGQCGASLQIPQTQKRLRDKVSKTLSFLGVSSHRKKVIVPGYKLQDKIREDATGILYKAISEETNKTVLIKIFNEETRNDTAFMPVLQNTIQKSLSLDIPYLSRNLQFGSHEKSVFVVSEYVEGPTLAELLQRNSEISVEKAFKIIIRVAKILKQTAASGIMHGDLTPHHIIIAPNGKVVVTQFGIPAKAVRNVFFIVEKDGIAPLYLAPEHVSGNEPPDYHSDIYSLGTILYHILAGRPPLEGNTPFALLTIMSENIPLPSLHLYNPNIPDEICQIVEKMMAFERKERYSSYEDLIEDLQNPSNVHRHKSNTSEKMDEHSDNIAPVHIQKIEDDEETPEAKLAEEATDSPPSENIISSSNKRPLSDSTATQVSPSTDIAPQKNEIQPATRKVPGRPDRAERPIVRGNKYQKNIWMRWALGSLILIVVGWGIWTLVEKQMIYTSSSQDYDALCQDYRNMNDPNHRPALKYKIKEYIAKYKDVTLPKYKNNRTNIDEAKIMLNTLNDLDLKVWQFYVDERTQQITDLLAKKKFCSALTLLEVPLDIPAEMMESIHNLRPRIIEEATAHTELVINECKTSLEKKEAVGISERLNELLQNCTQDGKAPADLEKIVAQIQQTIQETKQPIEECLKLLAEEKHRASQKILDNYFATVKQMTARCQYRQAKEYLNRYLDDSQLIPEHQQQLVWRSLETEQLGLAKDFLIKYLPTILRSIKTKIMYRKQYKEIRRIDYYDVILEPDIQVKWQDFPKDQLAVFIQCVLNNRQSTVAERYAYSILYAEIGNYNLAYQLLTNLPKTPEVTNYIAYLENLLTKNSTEYLNLIQNDLKANKAQTAMEHALWAQENCFLPGQWENPNFSKYQEFFLAWFRNLVNDANTKELFFDFSQTSQLSKYENTQNKFSVQAGQLEFMRGNLFIPLSNVQCVAGLACMHNLEDEILISLRQNNQPSYSLKLRGDGNLYYNVLATGVIKNEELALLQDWCMFCLIITKTNVSWYVNGKLSYSIVLPNNTRCDSVQIQVKAAKEAVSFDNLYFVFQ